MKDCVILPQVKIDDQEALDVIQELHREHGYEGTMVRNNIYSGKRSWNLMKVKGFLDAEFEVVGTINDNMRWIELGEDIERETMASVKIEYKGCIVGVGSGFSKEQRDFYYQYPDEIIGKIITVQYFEEIEKRNGLKKVYNEFKEVIDINSDFKEIIDEENKKISNVIGK